MIDWAERARLKFAAMGLGGTDKTDETPLSSVSSVGAGDPSANFAYGQSGALARHGSSGNPHMTPAQGNLCHEGGWDDAQIQAFLIRTSRFSALGRSDAELLAERLTLRDLQDDDRHFCLECRELQFMGRCAAARRGDIEFVDPRLEPMPDILMRCPNFKPISTTPPVRQDDLDEDQA